MSPVQRTGGVRVGGDSTAVGQPSPSPGFRSDLIGFNTPFDRDKFTRMIAGSHGYDVKWETAQYCPFIRGPSPKAHDINCKVCHSGFIYYNPVETKMLVMSLGLAQQYFAYGRFDSGKSQITAFPEFKVSFWDRITLVNARARHTELIVRQRDSLTDRPKFNILCVERIIWAIAEQTFDTANGEDFTVDATTGELVWLTDHRPGADTYYSIVYYYRPIYIVLETPHHVRDEKTTTLGGAQVSHEFPVQVIAQLDAFTRNEGLDVPGEGDIKNPFEIQR